MPIKQVLRSDNFYVDVAGQGGSWASVGELTSEINVSTEKTTTAGAKTSNRALPGEQDFNELTISRFTTDDKLFSDWFAKVAYDGELDVRNITITIYDSTFNPAVQVNVINAVPTGIDYAEFSAENAELQTEDITLAYEYWERVS